MANNKDFECRMSGMLYAYEIAKKGGVEGLEKEIKRRGISKVPIKITESQMNAMLAYLSRNLYANLLSTFGYGLHELYGFGEKRIKRLIKYIDVMVKNTFDMDYMGEHYIRLEDYAIELNEKYHLGIDVEAIASCQTVVDEEEKSGFHYAKIEKILEVLEEAGFPDASEYLRKKVQ